MTRLVICFCIVVMLFSSPAYAVEVGIVNMIKINRDATAMKDLNDKFQAKRKEHLASVTEKEEKLRSEEQKLAEQRAIMAPDAFNSKKKEFKERVIEVNQNVQKELSQLDTTFNKALDEVSKAAAEIVADVAKEKKLDLVLHRRQALYATDGLDITDSVLERLNKKLPKVEADI